MSQSTSSSFHNHKVSYLKKTRGTEMFLSNCQKKRAQRALSSMETKIKSIQREEAFLNKQIDLMKAKNDKMGDFKQRRESHRELLNQERQRRSVELRSRRQLISKARQEMFDSKLAASQSHKQSIKSKAVKVRNEDRNIRTMIEQQSKDVLHDNVVRYNNRSVEVYEYRKKLDRDIRRERQARSTSYEERIKGNFESQQESIQRVKSLREQEQELSERLRKFEKERDQQLLRFRHLAGQKRFRQTPIYLKQ